ncbi:hypothetical protein COHA_005663 [Chlorella ohadii]|uniref:Uncharacterized protein n=1 Tax=Chlorella ohadii TaxID=2649997 RepID=A0AAD5DN42_9CHLO|nr:hypothetical protein COHA_005663 [Chlorella ohadii]
MTPQTLTLSLLCVALVQLAAAENVTLCWGRGADGQLGNGMPAAAEGDSYGSQTPVVVSGGRSFASVCSGMAHSCALEPSGLGVNGQLGTGSNASSNTPVEVSGSHTFRAITCGRFHTCALDAEGATWCWGVGSVAPSSEDESPISLVPVRAAEGHAFEAVCAGYDHTCGLDASGRAHCWGCLSSSSNIICAAAPAGNNGAGSLGAGLDAEASQTPVEAAGNHTFASLSCGVYHTCGLDDENRAWCWGSSVFGELGSGSNPGENEDGFESEPVAVAGEHAFASISAGYSHTCGLTLNSSALLCWGESPGNGQGLTPRTLLTEPTEPAWAADSGLSFVAVSTADDATCALDDDSNIWCFGGGSTYDPAYNAADGTASATPVKLAGGHSFLALGTAHVLHMCAIAAKPAGQA